MQEGRLILERGNIEINAKIVGSDWNINIWARRRISRQVMREAFDSRLELSAVLPEVDAEVGANGGRGNVGESQREGGAGEADDGG
jgi:hypothetical protein